MQPDRCQPRKSVRRPAEQAFVHNGHEGQKGEQASRMDLTALRFAQGRLLFQKFAFWYSVGLMPVSFLKVPEK